jgi:dTDP-4-dehydrorhamnose reductase
MMNMPPRLKTPYYNPEIWGGIECTINRIGDEYSDQLQDTGHYSRKDDLHQLAGLGIKALRYPVLWERHQPEKNGVIDWSWAESQLDQIRRREITPIVGLLHHGSGPSFTHLACPHFPEDFAAYAGEVAARFPWVDYYTPINEPLTTARFSGLYGLWYPHRTHPLEFLTMLLNQLKGTILAMKAIRQVNRDARLVQTEDLTKIHSSPELSYQADFENHRRWLTFDLLCGRVDYFHPLWDYFLSVGITPQQLSFFIANPCPPDIMGLNYYITSERYLDGDLAQYPPERLGGNGRHQYVDTEAVNKIRPAGLYRLVWEAWERYRLPIAITEVHLNAAPAEQIQWVKTIWENSCKAKEMGVDLRAVTIWALLGSVDWDSLLIRKNGHYESGVFDIGDNGVTMNALGFFIQSLAADRVTKGLHTHNTVHP